MPYGRCVTNFVSSTNEAITCAAEYVNANGTGCRPVAAASAEPVTAVTISVSVVVALVALVTLCVSVFVVLRRRQRNLDQAKESIATLNASLTLARQASIDRTASIYKLAGDDGRNETYM